MINIKMDRKTESVSVKIADLTKKNKEGLRRGFQEMGANLVRQTQNKILGEPKYGRVYKLKDGSTHTSSAPNQTPALLTGEYYEGLGYISNGWQGLKFINTAEHAPFLERGTKKMKRRPGMANAIRDNLRNNRNYITQNLAREFA